MITVQIRKQGGAAIITIPSDLMKILSIEVGSTLELDISDNGFIAHPVKSTTRKRYSLSELLQGSTPKKVADMKKQTQWARDGKAFGREIE